MHSQPHLISADNWINKHCNKAGSANYRIITANQRLARQIQASINRLTKTSRDKYLSDTIKVTSYQQFVTEHWQAAQNKVLRHSAQQLLTSQQERHIWRQILSQYSVSSSDLTDPSLQKLASDLTAASKSIGDAFNIESEWQIEQKQLENHPSPQLSLYLKVRQLFLKALHERQWITQAGAATKITHFFNEQQLPTYAGLGLYGFVELSPLQRLLLEAASDKAIDYLGSLKSDRYVERLDEFSEFESEIKYVASWASELLRSLPDASIGIIIPALHTQKAEVERLFNHQFAPISTVHPTFDETPDAPFEMSLGTPLINEPIIFDAIHSLNLINQTLQLNEAKNILNSPYWGEGLCDAKTRAMQTLARWPMGKLTCAHFLEQLKPLHLPGSQAAPNAQESTGQESTGEDKRPSQQYVLDARMLMRPLLSQSHPLSFWGETFIKWLSALGWPGPRVVNSREYQACQIMSQILGELSEDDKYALESPKVTLSDFQKHLKERLTERVFQLQKPTKPIQILGALEAIGLEFDHCWICDVTSQNFPAPASPNPFLPFALQKTLGTPRSSAQKELEYAIQTLETYVCSSSHVFASFSQMAGDTEQEICPLIHTFMKENVCEGAVVDNPLDQLKQKFLVANSLTIQRTQSGRKIKPPSDNAQPIHIRSGVRAIDDTGLNPLNSYFIHRLGAQQPTNETLGLSPIAKGNVFHAVVADYWREIRTHHAHKNALAKSVDEAANLQSDSPIHKLLLSATTAHITNELRGLRELIPAALVELETQRIVAVVFEWLKSENHRPDFEVLACEQKTAVDITAGLYRVRFDVTIDRIDLTPNNQLIIIDYKTGAPKIQDTLTQPLVNCQLPVYTLIEAPHNIAGVTFAHLASNSGGFLGYGEPDLNIQGITTTFSKSLQAENVNDWQTLKEYWQQSINTNLTYLVEGNINAPCAPKNSPKNLFYSYLDPINRQHEQPALQERLTRMLNSNGGTHE